MSLLILHKCSRPDFLLDYITLYSIQIVKIQVTGVPTPECTGWFFRIGEGRKEAVRNSEKFSCKVLYNDTGIAEFRLVISNPTKQDIGQYCVHFVSKDQGYTDFSFEIKGRLPRMLLTKRTKQKCKCWKITCHTCNRISKIKYVSAKCYVGFIWALLKKKKKKKSNKNENNKNNAKLPSK